MKNYYDAKQLTEDVKQATEHYRRNVAIIFPSVIVRDRYIAVHKHSFGGICNELRCKRRSDSRVMFMIRKDPCLLDRVTSIKMDAIYMYKVEDLTERERNTLLAHERRATKSVRST